MNKGFLVTFEGIDGTGKTTQLSLLKQWFEVLGKEVVVAKEPGDLVNGVYVGSSVGAGVRHLLFKDPTTKRMSPGVNDLLFLADHVQLQGEVIQPAIDAGKIVLCDRYSDSQYAYSVGKDSPAWAMEAFEKGTYIRPRVIVLLTGNPVHLAHRTKRVGTVDEGKQDGKVWASVEHQGAIQRAYFSHFLGYNNVVHVTDVHKIGIDEVHAQITAGILQLVTELTQKGGACHEEVASEAGPLAQ